MRHCAVCGRGETRKTTNLNSSCQKKLQENSHQEKTPRLFAESAGFEPAKRVTACLVSNEVVSATHPTLLKAFYFYLWRYLLISSLDTLTYAGLLRYTAICFSRRY